MRAPAVPSWSWLATIHRHQGQDQDIPSSQDEMKLVKSSLKHAILANLYFLS
jgi:hypothetical protein